MIIFITQNIEIFILNYMSRVYSSKHIAHIIHNVKLRANLLCYVTRCYTKVKFSRSSDNFIIYSIFWPINWWGYWFILDIGSHWCALWSRYYTSPVGTLQDMLVRCENVPSGTYGVLLQSCTEAEPWSLNAITLRINERSNHIAHIICLLYRFI